MMDGSPNRTVDDAPSTRRGRWRSLALAIGLVAASLSGSAVAAPAPAPARPEAIAVHAPQKPTDFRIIAFGSSSTQGVGASSQDATYPAQLQRLFSQAYEGKIVVSVANRGIGGEDINDMMRRINADVLSRKADLVIWQVGSNDLLRGVPIDQFKAELRAGIAAIHRSGAEVVLMEPQWCPTINKVNGSDLYVAAVREVGAEQHLDVVRRYELMQHWMADGTTPRDLVGADGLHMTDKGYALLAKAVFDEISANSVVFHADMSRTASSHL